jgi:DNA polymerase III alpha subunit
MCFLTGSDNTGSITLILFPDLYKENNNFKKNEIIKVTGKVEKRYDEYQIVCIKIDR